MAASVPSASAAAGPRAPLPADVDALRAREASENFPVALRVLPAELRTHLRAVYDVARTVDELGDAADGDRVALLEDFAEDVHRVWAGCPARWPVLARLAGTVEACDLPVQPVLDLVAANLQDQRVRSYDTWDQLLGYCDLSAAPVGRLVLAVLGVGAPAAQGRSDRVCAALQVLEHCQDVAEDRRAGRTYLPTEDLLACGVREGDLDAATSSPAVRAVLALEVDRAAALLAEGPALVGALHGWGRLAVGGYVAGGLATVDALRRPGTDVLAATPRPRRADVFRHLALLLARTP